MNPSTNIHQAKSELRQEMRATLRALTPAQHREGSERILQHLTSDRSWLPQGGVVAVFGGLKSEPELLPLIAWLGDCGVRAAFFAMGEEGQMLPHVVSGADDLVEGSLGVFEPLPRETNALKISQLDVILVPGLAFGVRDGSRLGRGKGFYDRVLNDPQCRARSIGVCLALQCRDTVPQEPHDAAVQALVTEDGWRTISPAVPS